MMVMHWLCSTVPSLSVHLEDGIEGLIRPSAAAAALELHRACAARRCGQRRDLGEWGGVRAAAIGRRQPG